MVLWTLAWRVGDRGRKRRANGHRGLPDRNTRRFPQLGGTKA
ncbi:MAG: hypothetical protein N3E46_01605 [Gemmataceae bacterium]|nr:hypothetical protein [Thermogemmata fonticola]MCX8138364.1 hypothetical protein [Gemmataceae bacterium]